MTKATHAGTCQICGAVQKLPGGVLAKHGYTTRWGFFSGICQGAGNLPFEQSADLIAEAVAHADRRAAGLRTAAEALRLPAKNNHVCAEVFTGTSRANPTGYTPMFGEMVAADAPRHGQWFQVLTPAGERHYVGIRAPRGDVGAAVQEANRLYADRQERQAASLDEYAAWQRKRLQAWAPGELQAL